jgi:hypothetical protein
MIDQKRLMSIHIHLENVTWVYLEQKRKARYIT